LRQSTKDGLRNKDGAKQRIAMAMEGQAAAEADALAERLNFLATTGAVAPFVGLFGTVWGIMNSFFQIGQQQNSSLAVVAPGISEALFATAIGLFAAIPATIAYNRFSHRVNAYEARLQRFGDKVHAQIGRELERT
jgi:biopolymer transport protein TolQ